MKVGIGYSPVMIRRAKGAVLYVSLVAVDNLPYTAYSTAGCEWPRDPRFHIWADVEHSGSRKSRNRADNKRQLPQM